MNVILKSSAALSACSVPIRIRCVVSSAALGPDETNELTPPKSKHYQRPGASQARRGARARLLEHAFVCGVKGNDLLLSVGIFAIALRICSPCSSQTPVKSPFLAGEKCGFRFDQSRAIYAATDGRHAIPIRAEHLGSQRQRAATSLVRSLGAHWSCERAGASRSD